VACARDAVADFWDGVIREALVGGDPHRRMPVLRRWFDAYRGAGRGVVSTAASPEPYIGPLRTRFGSPRLVALGLNPGPADLSFQAAGGVFAREYEQHGGFSAWAVSEPYLRPPWALAHPRNPYHENLRVFARAWLDDPSIRSRDVLVFELYPWHSDRATAAMTPDVDLVEEFIWRPISEVQVDEVIAIGAPWQRIAEKLGLSERELDVTFSDRTRRARSFGLPSGQELIVTWHQASNRPPNATDARALKRALSRPRHPPAPIPTASREPAGPRVRKRGATGRATAPGASTAYRLFWAQLTDRLHHERPLWRLGTPNGNDYPLLRPLPGARIKCNLSRQGLRVELLLHSPDRATNLRRLEVLTRNLRDLEHAFDGNGILVPEPLPGRTQARPAAYHPGTIDEQHNWPSFLDWFQRASTGLEHALETTPAIRAVWTR
jgi:hypothetical protein